MIVSFYYKLILILGLTCIFTSCDSVKNDYIQIPPTVLSPKEFTELIVDFALAESASNLNIKSVTVEKIDSTYSFNPLIEHSVSKSTYDLSVSFYANHPLLYKKVYDSVLTHLSEIKQRTLK